MSRRLLLSALLLAALVFAACGGDDTQPTPQAEAPSPTVDPNIHVQNQPAPVQAPNGTPAQPQEGVYEIIAQDTAFQGNDVTIPLGSSAVIRVTNRDQLTHNLRLAGLDGLYDTEDDAVTEPPAIEPGGSGEFTFAPAIPGAYTFRCDYHPGSMGGQITVQ